MNIVELLKSQLSSDVIGNLGRTIGEDEDKTKAAVGAAAPALLAGLSGLASSTGGAQKLAGALGAMDAEGAGSLAGMLSGQGGSLLEQSEKLLGSLFGGSSSAIVGAISKFTGIPQAVIQKVVGVLLPMILGVVAKQVKGKGLSPQNLTDFFADQKQNISSALPSGLSLASIPGMQSPGNVARAATGAAQEAGTSVAKWLVPLAGVLLLGLLLWHFWGPPAPQEPVGGTLPKGPDIKVVAQKFSAEAADTGKAVTDVTTSLTKTLGEIKDEATAESALPKLKDASQRLDEIRGLWDRLPDAAKTTIAASVTPQLDKLKALIEPIIEMPGVGSLVKPILDEIVKKLSTFGE
jgi:hypothetical protein